MAHWYSNNINNIIVKMKLNFIIDSSCNNKWQLIQHFSKIRFIRDYEGFINKWREYSFFIIFLMLKNCNQEPNEMEMSIFTFTHDYYMLELPPLEEHKFYNDFPIYLHKKNYKGEPIKTAPIVRIYGTNQCNQKCCCHVHGYFPFLYIKLEEYQLAIKKTQFLLEFLLKIQSVYQQAFKTNKDIVLQAQIQYKFDFYGYHTQKQAFLKIYLYDPGFTTRMRQLLSSKLIGNKSFQCYQAHINYYMQFFSDFNIYGINEIKICGFTFRKNLKIMKLFQKISSNLTEGIVHRGWNLEELLLKKPQSFNCLYKMSCCYIEIDFTYHSILNSYQLKDSEGEDEILSSDQEMISRVQGVRKMRVNVTKALEQIWRDQKKRRNRFKIRATLEGRIDLSKNIEMSNQGQESTKDPLWISFLNKGQNGNQLLQMIKSYKNVSPLQQSNQLKIDLEGSSFYQERLANQKQELINKVRGRMNFYQQRKKRIINEIISGDRDELPEWSDDQNDDQISNQSQADSWSSGDSQKSDNSKISKLINNKSNSQNSVGNTIKYRNNFKFELADFKTGSLFTSCRFCRQKNYICSCLICQKCGEEQCRCIVEQQTVLAFQKSYSQLIQLEYQIASPTIEEVIKDRIVQHQRPYYSKIQDLFQHYKLGPNIPIDNITSQYLQKQVKNTAYFNRDPITIKNQEKLPYYYEIYKQKIQQYPKLTTYELQYTKLPPSLEEACPKKITQKPKNRGTSTYKYEDTFVSDLIVMTYQLLIEIQQNNLYYGNPQIHPLYGTVFEIYNEQSPHQSIRGVIITQKYYKEIKDSFLFDQILVVKNEEGVLSLLINLVFRIDIDIFMSWDMQKKGIRYLLQRGIYNHINMAKCLSRVNDLQDIFQHLNFLDFVSPKQTYLKRQYLTHGNVIELASSKPTKENTYYLNILNQKLKKRLQKKPILRQKYFFDMQIKGRINMNLSRLCQELRLKSYTLESVVMHLYNIQLSQFTDKYLCQSSKQHPESALQHLQKRLQYQKLITHEVNFIGSIVEKSKVYGADFLSMMQRGSQFKIQSIMCRTTKQNGYLTLSATKAQVGYQSLLQCRPFVLEPPKQFYAEPVLLFDFQSLYPSVMIAYNLCYSTCLGSIKQLFKQGKRKKLGVSSSMSMHMQKICELIQNQTDQEQMVKNLGNNIFITPNKVAFVKKNMKEGFIPKILLQFLITRIMIKNSTKLYSKQSIKNILKERQNALKLFMNVMFGYTGASFSGRMPCSQIADSVVEVAKYCLRKSIDYLNAHPIYKGKVLYGDTDSIFFHLPNYHIKQTFQIGRILSNEITKLFPYPMQMKFEKVYESLFLISKKRYYGKSYQTADSKPKYQGKGLQIVRRDGIPFTSNVMCQILNTLIDTKDLSTVKTILLEQSKKLLQGEVNLSQLCLAKQVKLLKYTSKYCPAHGEAAKRLENIDPMLVPKYGDRLKYLVTEGTAPIRNRAIPLFEYMLKKDKYQLDYNYYYTKLFLPPLRRALISLFNIDEWGLINQHSRQLKQERQFKPSHQHSTQQMLCEKCLDDEFSLIKQDEEQYSKICRQCVGERGINYQLCVQWNCKNLYKRRKAYEQYNTAKQMVDQLKLIKQILSIK